MIRSIVRSIAAVAAGLLVAFVLVVLVEGYSALVHPFPDGDFSMLEHVAAYPAWVLASVVPMWSGTVLLGVWLATRFGSSRHPAHGWGVGLLLLWAVAFNQWMLPYPKWFEFANLVLFPLATIVGIRWARASTPAASPTGS